jgi:hypothetical protein
MVKNANSTLDLGNWKLGRELGSLCFKESSGFLTLKLRTTCLLSTDKKVKPGEVRCHSLKQLRSQQHSRTRTPVVRQFQIFLQAASLRYTIRMTVYLAYSVLEARQAMG